MSTGKYKKGKAPGRKTVYKHRVAMERHLGRKLGRLELVHHKNEDRSDNSIDNLELTTPVAHSRHHMLEHHVEKPCVVCGTMFTPLPSHRPRDLTCGRRCKRIVLSVARSGRAVDYRWIKDQADAGMRGYLIGRRLKFAGNAIYRMLNTWTAEMWDLATNYARRRFGVVR